MYNYLPIDFEHAHLTEVIAAVDLSYEHSELARQLCSDIFDTHADEFVDDCLKRLEHEQNFFLIAQSGFIATFRCRWIDYLRNFGHNFDSPGYLKERMDFAASCANAGIPLSLLLLVHNLIQRNVIEYIATDGRLGPSIHVLTDCVIKLNALDVYLMTEGYRHIETGIFTRSLTELHQEILHLRQQTSTDQLTGLVSYHSLMDLLAREIEVAHERHQPLCVLMADLDFFKKVNDKYGHLVGDLVLRHTGERMQAAVRDFDIVGRFGGEEFTVILKNTDLGMSVIIAERIREEIANSPFHVNGLKITITISLGLAMLRAGEKIKSLLERADKAMYEAKLAGRNCVVIANH